MTPTPMSDGLFPIYIATKARYNKSPTINALLKLDKAAEWYIVVEPQDVPFYAEQVDWSRIISLPLNDQGLPYARRFILELRKNDGWFWMLDDDIEHFYRTVDARNHRIPIDEALRNAQPYFATQNHIAQASLEYSQFAWSAKTKYVTNGYCDVCVAIHGERSYPYGTFRDEVSLKLDRDFTLQLLSYGLSTIRVTEYSFSAPKNGSNAGGLYEEYATEGREALASKRMVELWPGVCSLQTKNDGRPDVKINWKIFKHNGPPTDNP